MSIEKQNECKLMPSTSTKTERAIKHKVRVEVKKAMRARRYNMQKNNPVYIPANLSRKHPDYGMSMQDHLMEKEARNS